MPPHRAHIQIPCTYKYVSTIAITKVSSITIMHHGSIRHRIHRTYHYDRIRWNILPQREVNTILATSCKKPTEEPHRWGENRQMYSRAGVAATKMMKPSYDSRSSLLSQEMDLKSSMVYFMPHHKSSIVTIWGRGLGTWLRWSSLDKIRCHLMRSKSWISGQQNNQRQWRQQRNGVSVECSWVWEKGSFGRMILEKELCLDKEGGKAWAWEGSPLQYL